MAEPWRASWRTGGNAVARRPTGGNAVARRPPGGNAVARQHLEFGQAPDGRAFGGGRQIGNAPGAGAPGRQAHEFRRLSAEHHIAEEKIATLQEDNQRLREITLNSRKAKVSAETELQDTKQKLETELQVTKQKLETELQDTKQKLDDFEQSMSDSPEDGWFFQHVEDIQGQMHGYWDRAEKAEKELAELTYNWTPVREHKLKKQLDWQEIHTLLIRRRIEHMNGADNGGEDEALRASDEVSTAETLNNLLAACYRAFDHDIGERHEVEETHFGCPFGDGVFDDLRISEESDWCPIEFFQNETRSVGTIVGFRLGESRMYEGQPMDPEPVPSLPAKYLQMLEDMIHREIGVGNRDKDYPGYAQDDPDYEKGRWDEYRVSPDYEPGRWDEYRVYREVQDEILSLKSELAEGDYAFRDD